MRSVPPPRQTWSTELFSQRFASALSSVGRRLQWVRSSATHDLSDAHIRHKLLRDVLCDSGDLKRFDFPCLKVFVM